ncbi:MAG: hypothetical protein HON65_12365 [Rhodospirillales bacterium]|jgi:hypothetical protein|nr:hypothetical protein [Rhodospirillales bacterium]
MIQKNENPGGHQQPSVAVYALDTALTRQDEFDKAAERKRELEHAAEIRREHERRDAEARQIVEQASQKPQNAAQDQDAVEPEIYRGDGNAANIEESRGENLHILT